MTQNPIAGSVPSEAYCRDGVWEKLELECRQDCPKYKADIASGKIKPPEVTGQDINAGHHCFREWCEFVYKIFKIQIKDKKILEAEILSEK